MSAIIQYLERHGPSLSTDVAHHLVKLRSIKPATARQQVSRMPPEVKRLAYITFPRNARFVYLVEQYGSPLFWHNLIQALEVTNSAYGAALAAVRARGGVVPLPHFEIVSGSPVRQKKHLSAERVLTHLVESKLLVKCPVDGIGECVALPKGEPFMEIDAREVRARLLAEGVLISAVANWLRNNGIVSYGRVARRDKGAIPKVGTAAWDVTAPCYLAGLLPRSSAASAKDNPAFFVSDLLLGRVDAQSVRPFVRKCMALRSLRRVSPCLQMFVADGYTADARDLLKRNGIIAATTGSLFGKEVAAGLRELVSFFKSIIDGSNSGIARFDELLSRINVIEGAALQLRGTLFEFLCERIAMHEFGARRTYMNRTYVSPTDSTKKAEVDVAAEYGNKKIVFIECKSTSAYSTVPDEQFARWLQHNVPTVFERTRAEGDWRNHELSFEFWASAPLTDVSQQLYASMKATINPNRYSVNVRLGDDLSRMCEDMGDPSIITAFDKHFQRK